MKRTPINSRVIDDVYAGTLAAQWALAIGYFVLGFALLLLDVHEVQRFRVVVADIPRTLPWPAPGFWLRAVGAGLVVGSLAIPVFQWYLARRERPALIKTIQEDPSKLAAALNYVGNVGVAATSLGIVAGLASLVLLFVDQISRPDSALQHFQFSLAVWLGGASVLPAALTMLALVLWRRAEYK